MGVPQSSIFMGFSLINQAAIGVPPSRTKPRRYGTSTGLCTVVEAEFPAGRGIGPPRRGLRRGALDPNWEGKTSKFGGFLKVMGVPQFAGWFVFGKIPVKWMITRGTPISGSKSWGIWENPRHGRWEERILQSWFMTPPQEVFAEGTLRQSSKNLVETALVIRKTRGLMPCSLGKPIDGGYSSQTCYRF